jgi:hypothetical protein
MKHQHALVIGVTLLAVAQGIFGILRALDWVRIGADLTRRGLLFTPMIGLVAIARGWIVALVAFIYILFAVVLLLGKSWAWWLGVVAVILNVLLVVNALTGGAPYGRAVIWLIVPVVVLVYLFSKSGWRGLAGQSNS